MNTATHIAQKGWGYDYYPQNFGRLTEDTPVTMTTEYAKPGNVIVLRCSDGLRMHVTKRALIEIQ